MSKKPIASSIVFEEPEQCYDIQKAVDIKTIKMKPRLVALSNFSKETPRDELLLRANDAYTNVILENSKSEREQELELKK